ncbi:hypothetical protein DSECCO2_468220 [anaerobic digester metagenome]
MGRIPSIKLLPRQLEPFNIIPLKGKSYNPNPSGVIGWKEYQVVDYPRKRLVHYYGNLGVILGKYEEGYKPSSKKAKDTLAILGITEEVEDYREYYLVQIDIDNPEHYQYFQDLATFTVKSGKGYHVYLISTDPITTMKDYPAVGIETRSIGSLSVVPPSIHPDTGNQYQVEKDLPILEVKNAYDFCSELIPEELRTPLKQVVTTKGKGKHKFKHGKDRNLTPKIIEEIVNIFNGIYTPASSSTLGRDHIVFSLSGWLRKAGITQESTLEVIEALATTYNDEELQSRLIVASRTYEEVEVEGTLGSKGVKDILIAKDPQGGEDRFLRLELILDGVKPWHDKKKIKELMEKEI